MNSDPTINFIKEEKESNYKRDLISLRCFIK